MRKLVTGLDADGRSCVVEDTPIDLAPREGRPGINATRVTEVRVADLAAHAGGRGMRADLGVTPGLVAWTIVVFEPGAHIPMHYTDTIDFGLVVEGSLTMALDDGEHALRPGDVIIQGGVDHAWAAGPDGCRMSVIMIGTPLPA